MITDRKPPRRVGVGSMYLCFVDKETSSDNNLVFEEEVERLKSLVSITVEDNSETENTWGSNEIYEADTNNSAPTLTVEALAFTALQKARMKGMKVDGGYVTGSTYDDGEYFAYGVVYPKRNGHFTYVWYPKCKAVSFSDEANTRDDDGINSQSPQVEIQTFQFNDNGQYKLEYDTELLTDSAARVTEAQFFAKPLLAPITE